MKPKFDFHSVKFVPIKEDDMQDSSDVLRPEAASKATQDPEGENKAQADKKDYSAIIYVAVGIILFLPILLIFKRS